MQKRLIILGVLIALLIGFLSLGKQKIISFWQSTPVDNFRIVEIYPHDTKAFTQGLVYEQGTLYEGTGLKGQSSLRRIELETGKVLQIHKLADHYFGEGITVWKNKIIQLTWTSQVGFVYDRKTFKKLREFTYPTEGWGITHDGKHLIMSDGTDNLYFLDPETFQEISRISVKDQGKSIIKLNELEYINGEIFANVWQTNRIARISPKTGEVLAWINLKGLIDIPPLPAKGQPQNVLNGIAYDAKNNRIFVTGKLWPKLFEIEIVDRKQT